MDTDTDIDLDIERDIDMKMNMDIDKKMDMDKNTRTHTWARRQLFNFNTYFLPGKSGDYFLSYSSCPHCKPKKNVTL
jgi:hypothetical protein